MKKINFTISIIIFFIFLFMGIAPINAQVITAAEIDELVDQSRDP